MAVSAATRPAEIGEQSPVALPLSTPKLTADLFAFLPGSTWEVRGTTVERAAIFRGERCSLVAETEHYNGHGPDVWEEISLSRSYLSCRTEAGMAEIVCDADVSRMLDEMAGEAVEENLGELKEGWAER